MQQLDKFFLVGGCVRDQLLGVPSKDFDFVVLVDSFAAMEEEIIKNGGEIFLRKPDGGPRCGFREVRIIL